MGKIQLRYISSFCGEKGAPIYADVSTLSLHKSTKFDVECLNIFPLIQKKLKLVNSGFKSIRLTPFLKPGNPRVEVDIIFINNEDRIHLITMRNMDDIKVLSELLTINQYDVVSHKTDAHIKHYDVIQSFIEISCNGIINLKCACRNNTGENRNIEIFNSNSLVVLSKAPSYLLHDFYYH